jgi:hypothetical protein
MIDGGGSGRFDAVGAKAVEQSVHVPWVGERESALGAVVREGEAQELRGDGVRLDEVGARKTSNEEIVVVAIVVLNTKIVDD